MTTAALNSGSCACGGNGTRGDGSAAAAERVLNDDANT